MEDLIQKYFSPGVILPLETDAYVELPFSATFQYPKADLPFSAIFLNETVASGSIVSGTAASVITGMTSTILNVNVAGQMGSIAGIECSGDGNGIYELFVNNIKRFRFLTNIIHPNIQYKSPILIALQNGDNLRIAVTNTGDSTSDYFASCIGSF